MRKYIPYVVTAVLASIVFAALAWGQPGIAINKDSTLRGTGSAGSAMGVSAHVDFPGIVGLPVTEYGYGGIAATINNLAPSSKAAVHIECGDNEGTRITGIDATGYNTGDILVIENTDSREDDGVCVLRHENSSSTAANRFNTPEERDYYLATQEGVIAIREPQLDASGVPTANVRWKLIGKARHMRAAIQNLQIFPRLNVGIATPISGTYNDWQPTGDPLGSAWGQAGSNLAWLDHTGIRVAVNAAGATITGMYWGANAPTTEDNGTLKVITNYGSGLLTFKYRSGSSSANDQIDTPCSDDLVLAVGETVVFYHPDGTSYWETLGTSAPSRVCAARGTFTATDPANPVVTITPASSQVNGLYIPDASTGQAPSGTNQRHIWVNMTGTYNATSATQNVYGIVVQSSVSRSAGANSVDSYPLYSDCSGYVGPGACRHFFVGGETRVSGTIAAVGSSNEFTGTVLLDSNNTIGSSNTQNATLWGHLNTRGTAPTLSSCGASPSIDVSSNDSTGNFTPNTTTCTVTFSRTRTNKPSCLLWAEGTATNPTCTTSATAITCTVVQSGVVYNYHCFGEGVGAT